jgi:Rad3-related DNA helicase
MDKEESRKYTVSDITAAIKECLKVSPQVKATNAVVTATFNILKAMHVDGMKHVILEAGTGTGKSVIAYMVHFCSAYLETGGYHRDKLTYYLTSSKMLQEQCSNDITRFDFHDYMYMLKGTVNYRCLAGKDLMYPDRPCAGMKGDELYRHHASCVDVCPYKMAREEASNKDCAVLNYAYFLTVMNSSFNPFFTSRQLTICDEAHLVPNVVTGMYNFEVNRYLVNQCTNFLREIELNFGSKIPNFERGLSLLSSAASLFSNHGRNHDTVVRYFNIMEQYRVIHSSIIKALTGDGGAGGYLIKANKLAESLEELGNRKETLDNLVSRPSDISFESELVSDTDGMKIYKHILRDLSETSMIREKFLNKIEDGLYMSATFPPFDDYATTMGFNDGEWVGFSLPSTFDYSRSPVYLCNSGYLNKANFDSNIDKCIMDTLKICTEYHPVEKGIIHTSTFEITRKLEESARMIPGLKERLLTYTTPDEKEKCIDLMKNSSRPYIIAGPSLYEGIDLKDDQGRFNILLKVPYAGMTSYVRSKMERYPGWYNDETVMKIIQAIGRTNRNHDDYSSTYLIDSCFNKIIHDTNNIIISRLKKKYI